MQGEAAKLADEATSKYTHFMLAATGAAIGFTLDKSEPASASPAFSFFLLSVIAWCMSFYHGCRSIQTSITSNNQHSKC